jgi:hypothetical protein
MIALRALVVLTLDLVRRLLREPVVVRSLVFPTALCAATITATIGTVATMWPSGTLALTEAVAQPALVEEIEARGFDILLTANPQAAVEDGDALAGSDGVTIWSYKAGADATRMEGIVRQHLGAGWYPVTNDRHLQQMQGSRAARNLVRVIGALFAFYGIVFGAGSVARDRDEGTLDAELATAVPLWVHGAARWIAGSTVLTVFYAFAVFLFDGLIGTGGISPLLLHGAAACNASVAIGLVVIGRASLESGFIVPLSMGLMAVVSLMSFGMAVSGPEQLVPVASIFSQGASGLGALLFSFVFGAVATAVFTVRATVE